MYGSCASTADADPIAALPAWHLFRLHPRTARLSAMLVVHAPSLGVPPQETPHRKHRSQRPRRSRTGEV